MTTPFQSNEEFINKFDWGGVSQYYDPVIFTDTKVGFSIKRYYPHHIRYKPVLRKDGTPDNVVTIWVSYTHPDETKSDVDLKKVPLRVRVANRSLYRARHFDYDFSDNNCPTEDSVEQSNLTPKPIELEYNNEFFYNHENDNFINESGDVISGVEILDKAFKDHCDTVHRFKGWNLRFKLAAKSVGSGFLGLLINFLKFILKTVFGRTLENKDAYTALYSGYKKEDLKQLHEDSLNVFGYKASKPVIILFCALVSLFSFIRYLFDIKEGYPSYIASNSAKSITHGILALWFLDAIIPYLIFYLINIVIKLRFKIMFFKIKWR